MTQPENFTQAIGLLTTDPRFASTESPLLLAFAEEVRALCAPDVDAAYKAGYDTGHMHGTGRARIEAGGCAPPVVLGEDHHDTLVPGDGDDALEALAAIAQQLGVPCTQEAIEDAIGELQARQSGLRVTAGPGRESAASRQLRAPIVDALLAAVATAGPEREGGECAHCKDGKPVDVMGFHRLPDRFAACPNDDAATPQSAPGVDLEQFRDAVLAWKREGESRRIDSEGVYHLTLGPNHYRALALLDVIDHAALASGQSAARWPPCPWCGASNLKPVMDAVIADALASARAAGPEREKPVVHVGTLGHVDHGKTNLTATLTKVARMQAAGPEREGGEAIQAIRDDVLAVAIQARDSGVLPAYGWLKSLHGRLGAFDARVGGTLAATPQSAPGEAVDREQVLQDYLADYEFLGETVDGRDACYTPNERERLLIEDAIRGWDALELPATPQSAPGVNEAMVRRACAAFDPTGWEVMGSDSRHDFTDNMRRALEAALASGQSAAGEDEWNDESVWALIDIAERCGAKRDEGESGLFWTLDPDAFYTLETKMRQAVSAMRYSEAAPAAQAKEEGRG